MTNININHYSKILKINHKVNIIIPDNITKNTDASVIWLLHGYGGDETSWLRNTSIESLAAEHSYIIIMPEGLHSFYVDSSIFSYYSFFINEFQPYIQNLFNLSTNKRNNFLCGASMGGYGALNLFLKNNDKFKAVAALSPVMNLVDFINNKQTPMTETEFLSVFENMNNAEKQSLSLSDNQPNIKIVVGTKDFLYQSITKSTLNYEITTGNHTWSSWSKDLPSIIEWFNSFQ